MRAAERGWLPAAIAAENSGVAQPEESTPSLLERDVSPAGRQDERLSTAVPARRHRPPRPWAKSPPPPLGGQGKCGLTARITTRRNDLMLVPQGLRQRRSGQFRTSSTGGVLCRHGPWERVAMPAVASAHPRSAAVAQRGASGLGICAPALARLRLESLARRRQPNISPSPSRHLAALPRTHPNSATSCAKRSSRPIDSHATRALATAALRSSSEPANRARRRWASPIE
jgi:hypothetical protein